MNVGEICTRNPISAPAHTPVMEVARLMCERHVGAVVITRAPLDNPVAAGVLTDRDIVRALIERQDLARLRAEDIMAREPLVLSEEMPVAAAIERMSARDVRRAPVVSPHGTLTGLVSTDDLLGHLARELDGLARLLRQQPKHEHAPK
jgi:CBS domain-containing protein